MEVTIRTLVIPLSLAILEIPVFYKKNVFLECRYIVPFPVPFSNCGFKYPFPPFLNFWIAASVLVCFVR